MAEAKQSDKQLFIGNIPFSLRHPDLKKMCETFGVCTDAMVAYRGRKPRGFGFVTYETAKDAKAAQKKLDGSKVGEGDKERELHVVFANARDPAEEAAAKEKAAAPKKDKKPAKEVKKKEKAPEKKDKPDVTSYKVSTEQMAFLKETLDKYEVKGMQTVVHKLFDGIKDDPVECMAELPPKPEKTVRLRFNPTPEEQEMMAKADAKHEYKNKSLSIQSLIAYYQPSGDPAEKKAAAQMLKDAFKA